MENQITEIFKVALKRMPVTFTSNEFGKEIRNLGLGEQVIKNKLAVNFLRMNCDQVNKKTWVQRAPEDPQMFGMSEEEIKEMEDSFLETCISYLKEKGYKVLAPVTEFKEV